jgi:uncharacterized protein (UPF0264 family)
VVPVLIADGAFRAARRRVGAGCVSRLMLDLADKPRRSLLERVPAGELRRSRCRAAAGRLAGLAGALGAVDVPRLRALAPDVAGFRSAVCRGDRAAALDASLVRRLVVS